MSKDLENNIEQDDIDEIENFGDEDYGFIIGPNGELKTMVFPEDLMDDPPPEVKRILKIFGIKNIHQVEPRTLH